MLIKCIFLIFLSIWCVNSYLLSDKENEHRLEICGKFPKSKIYLGRPSTASEAPWSVLLQIQIGRGIGTCTGTLVSPRHILTASHCFTNLDFYGKRIIFNAKFNSSKCDEQEHYSLDDQKALDAVKIYHFNKDKENELGGGENLEKITLVQGCRVLKIKSRFQDPMMASVDLAILHLKHDIGKNLGLACVAEHRDMEKLGTEFQIFSYGLNPPPNAPPTFFRYYQEPVLRHLNLTVVQSPQKIHEHYFTAQDSAHKSTMCTGDSGGGLVGHVYGRITVVGVFFGASGCGTSTGFAEFTSVGYFSKFTCKIAGICEPNPLGEEIKIPLNNGEDDEKMDEAQFRRAEALISSADSKMMFFIPGIALFLNIMMI